MTNDKQRQAALERVDEVIEDIFGEAEKGDRAITAESLMALATKIARHRKTIQAALELAREQLAPVEGLKACPFCGGDNLLIVTTEYDPDLVAVECQVAYCGITGVGKTTEEKARIAWNTRTSPALEKLITERS